MKAVPDSMLWLSYVLHGDGPRHAAIDRAERQRVRLITSKYILDEVERTLTDRFEMPKRFVQLALQKILRMGREVKADTTRAARPWRPE